MIFIKDIFFKKNLNKHSAFVWDSSKKKISAINNFKAIKLDLIVGVNSQKDKLFNNTKNFSLGNFTNNVLLWGTRGNGKSSLVKSVFKLSFPAA